ncbi:hypothetical protein H0H92_015530 [Tricholoma furcatifolium]|nr:hypothetical protein H0H92_015530 [Tricholoma furcatifolium]
MPKRIHRLSLSIPVAGQSYADDSSPAVTPEFSPRLTPETSRTVTPDTPTLVSPISGVVDLTSDVKTVVESPVTTGGFSDIYRGVWTRNDGQHVIVAVKLLRVFSITDLEATRKRLNWEVYVWHRLDHPNVAKFFGTSYHMSGRPSMVMQWYGNGSAAEFLRGPLGHTADRCSLVLDVGRGLKYLHQQTSPIIHGDLKSNNVLITDDLHAVLSDFGLSQVIRAMQTDPTGFTPSNPESGPTRWQAPELHQDNTQPDLGTDVWGFGCTAYEMLSGNIPYYYRQRDASIIKDVESRIKPSGPDRMVLLAPNEHLQKLVDSCWSFTPATRPSMTEVVKYLEDSRLTL